MWADVLAIWWSQYQMWPDLASSLVCYWQSSIAEIITNWSCNWRTVPLYFQNNTHIMIMSIHVFSLNTEGNKPKLFVVKMNHLLESPLHLMLVLKSRTFAAYFPFPDNKFIKLSDWQVYNLTFSPIYSQHCKKIWTYQHQEITKYASFC